MAKLTTARRRTFETGAAVHRRCRCRRVLRSIETELEELREQNRILTESAGFFAELSERLNLQLRRHKAQGRLEEVVSAPGLKSSQDSLVVAYPFVHGAQRKA